MVEKPASIESDPLHAIDAPVPEPGPGEILVRVRTCGVCRTDLHVAEGDLPPRHPRIIPGHEVVGVVDERGVGAAVSSKAIESGSHGFARPAASVSIAAAAAKISAPTRASPATTTTAATANGPSCARISPTRFPTALGDEEAAPLLCAGIIGYRAIKRAEVRAGATVGLYGFGGSAHLAIQVLRHWGCRVFVMSRGGPHRDLAKDLGAEWIGNAEDSPPAPLDAAILFAPAGNLVPPALEALDRGGILAVAGIYLSQIPPLDYEKHLFYEKELRSVTANTRTDGEEFLKLAGEIPIRTSTVAFGLSEANVALKMLKHDEIKGAGVLRIS